ncbi:interferon alpha/beta receptor 2-like [Engraulis encrasicolus]|uniref:interferon alpha/beta receptor 2-like n=1 Tax=Engraulis encrasicolus TaxID=184585 RepID=UPI002FD0CF2C
MILLLALLLLCDVTQASPGAEVYSSLPAPVNVSVSLWQLHYVVRWSSGPHTPAGTHYHVKTLALSVSKWVSVPGCEHVSVCEDASVCEGAGAGVNVCVCEGASVCECVCDVTKVFSDPMETYYTQVTTQLGGRASNHSYHPPFKPEKNTEPPPPRASLGLSNQSQLSISLQPPADWLRPLYSLYTYNLSIHTHHDQPPVSVESRGLGGYLLSELVPGREYCVSVSILGHKNTLTHTTPHCLTAPTQFNTDAVLSVLLYAVLSVLLCVCVLACQASLSFSASRLLRLLRPDDPQMTSVSVATALPKDSQSESSDEDEDEDGEESGRRGGYERRVQDSPSPSDTAPSPPDTALSPPDTERYACLALMDNSVYHHQVAPYCCLTSRSSSGQWECTLD